MTPFHPEDIGAHADKWRSALVTGETFEKTKRACSAPPTGISVGFLIRRACLASMNGETS